ncbi:hypothetical protein C8F04DRAFT_1195720 [Mycena alexandri]|uniref:Uncharacterized protein n=1 Tax=Mycena alexandri TaxID=1745969 RepID=A0AAD6S0V3_9AGAR|nr:hypothetical protein C8F04DRAFT_1201483 [Mycena alexandri]KAJ7021240.1 hypothetical protein C8F04DRAFT_1195720 [Mycena alexandri]
MTKIKRSHEEVLESRAEAAWKYRQSTAANAKLRRRERLKSAPSDVQLEHRLKAIQYRRNYAERTKKGSALQQPADQTKTTKKGPSPAKPTAAKPSAAKRTAAVKHTTPAKPTKGPAPTKPVKPIKDITAKPTKDPAAKPRAVPSSKRPRARGSPSPKSLAAIEAGDSSSDEESSRSEDSDDEPRWTGGGRASGLSFAVRLTGQPGYVPLRGQQPFIRDGVRYWY